MNSESHTRNRYIDISKGIGMILVILGHCVWFGGKVHNWIFAFHMPLFFILAGFFLKRENYIFYFKKKIRGLIIPYIVFSIIGVLVSLIIPEWRKWLNVKSVLKDIYFANPNVSNVSSIWFLVCLFWCCVLIQGIFRVKEKRVQFVISLVLFMAGWGYSYIRFQIKTFENRLPLELDVMLIAQFFVYIGYMIYGRLIEFINRIKTNNWIYIIITFLISLAISIFNGRTNIRGLTFNNMIFYMIGSFVGSFFIILLSLELDKIKVISNCIEFFGKNSIYVLGSQAILIRLYILFVNKFFNKSYELYFLPIVHQVICFCITCALCCMICIFIKNMKIHFSFKKIKHGI